MKHRPRLDTVFVSALCQSHLDTGLALAFFVTGHREPAIGAAALAVFFFLIAYLQTARIPARRAPFSRSDDDPQRPA